MFDFMTEVVRNYRTTGAIAPSGKYLAAEITRPLREHNGPKRILEVGPGTGVFSHIILDALNPGDAFDLVEINDAFADVLEENFLREFREAHSDISVQLFNAAIEEVTLEGDYDYIICGLPFNLFPLPMVRRIFRTMMSQLKEGGELVYFEYLGMKAPKMVWFDPRVRKRTRQRVAMAKALERKYDGQIDVIVRNFPPAQLIRLTH